jgi:hypothetical protein
MLFPRNALASGPQAWFGAEKGLLKVKGGKSENPLDRNLPFAIIPFVECSSPARGFIILGSTLFPR